MRILIIDNNIDPDSWGASELCAMARRTQGATIHVRRAPQGDLPDDPRAFDRIIISGSKTSALEEAPWITRLDAFIRVTIDAGRPLLGVCYGHQALLRTVGGKHLLRRAPRGELGWVKVEVTERDSRLFRGLPRSFHTFAWHRDEATELPAGVKLLARSELCPIQACELEGRPVFGVQFHPERPPEAGEKSLAKALREDPKAECFGIRQGKKLFDTQVGETIFDNFLSLENS